MNVKNLIGQRFGRLVVLSESSRRQPYPTQKWYHCRCDCGNDINVNSFALTSGKRKSCGCLQQDSRYKDYTGQKYGYLTAIKPTGKVFNHSAKWEFQCDCGKIIVATIDAVKYGGKKSCGCKRDELNRSQVGAMQETNRKNNWVNGTNLVALRTKKAYKSNRSTGVLGVSLRKNGKYYARIVFKKRHYSLGYYDTLNEAIAARKAAEEKFFKPELDKFSVK